MTAIAPADRLDHILASIAEIEMFTAGKTFEHYMAEPMTRRAVERSIEIISEASRYIPDDLKSKYSSVPWRKVAGIGNVLRHGYKLVDDHELWDVITHDLPPLKATIETMLLELDSEPDGAP